MKNNFKTKLLFLIISAILTLVLVVIIGKNSDVKHVIKVDQVFEISKNRINNLSLTSNDPNRKLIKERNF